MEHPAFVSSFTPAVRVSTQFGAVCAQRVHREDGLTSSADAQMKVGLGGKLAAVALAALLAVPGGAPEALAFPSSLRDTSSELVAARSGGRVGGSSFRSAPRRSAPARNYGGGGSYYRGGYGGGYGGGIFAPMMPVMPLYYSPFGFMGGGGSLGLLVMAGAAVAVASRLRGTVWDAMDDDEMGARRSTAVVCLKLGLLANAGQVRERLDALARAADTSTPRGLARVLSETAVSLMRNAEYWVYAAAEQTTERDIARAETRFNETSVRERAKIADETLTNVGGIRLDSPRAVDDGAAPDEFVVVSLVVAADSALASKLPRRVERVEDVRKALGVLGAVGAEELQAVEVIWAPQQRNDSLTRAEMLLDHPELRAL